jgi:hypothetical protein
MKEILKLPGGTVCYSTLYSPLHTDHFDKVLKRSAAGVQIQVGVSLHCRPWKKPNLIVDTDVFLFYNLTYE